MAYMLGFIFLLLYISAWTSLQNRSQALRRAWPSETKAGSMGSYYLEDGIPMGLVGPLPTGLFYGL